MPISLFLVPMVQFGANPNAKHAKYDSGDPSIVRSGSIRFGASDDALLMVDAGQAYLDAIAADVDCRLLATPATIDDPLTAPQVSAIQTFFEGRGIPMDWLAAGETRREALRGIAGMFLFSQRMEGSYGVSWKQKLAQQSVTLATQWQNLPAQFQQDLLDTAATLGWSVQTPQPTTTLRAILRAMGNRFQGTTIVIGGMDL